MPAISEQKARELFGDPQEVGLRLRAFRESARVYSSSHPRLIDEFPRQWVAVYEGRVRTHASTIGELLAQVEATELPRRDILIRFIEEENQRALIL